MKFLSNFFTKKQLSSFSRFVPLINELEADLEKCGEEELLQNSLELQKKIQEGILGDELIPRAFALVREAAKRKLGQRHFDEQLIAGAVLHSGKIAEMLTGEGKTLAATLPTYLNALYGKGVHVVTVNDYLARRDAVWMGQIYHALGLKVSCLVHSVSYMYDPSYASSKLDEERDKVGSFRVVEKFLRPVSRKEAYEAHITYGTNHEFGFDYLRDNLTLSLSERVQRGHFYTIIDEVDSILIDEARTPLIIAMPDQESSQYYKTFARLADRLIQGEDYEVDEKLRTVHATDSGIEKVEKALGIQNLYDPQNARLVHFLEESLKAVALFRKDKEYVVKNNEVIIVDEFTGRMLHGRRYSGGLHQAIEAKENVLVQNENRTFAQITIQNYFRLYEKIAGMTGTAQTSAEEFHKVYNLDVVSIPPHRKVARQDLPDFIYKTKNAKYEAAIRDVKEKHERGQPVLVGTASIENNELLSAYLSKAGIPHEVLNAKNNEREGAIIAQAGKLGAVTVATNMAGRGVDIIFGGNPPNPEDAQKVRELGGLCVIGTERHEARRIDNQLRGRSGRQGDPGMSRFYLSLEDDLLRIFGGDRVKNLMQTLNFPEDVPIESKFISKVVNQAQQKVEGANLDIRRHLLDFDDVLNKQRAAIYTKRDSLLKLGEKNEIKETIVQLFGNFLKKIEEQLSLAFSESGENQNDDRLKEYKSKLTNVPDEIQKEKSIMIAQHLVRILDMLWVDHLENLDSLRTSVNIRAYGQHEPLVEYRREAHILFQKLIAQFEHIAADTVPQILVMEIQPSPTTVQAINTNQNPPVVSLPSLNQKIGRNDPCPCGSGKKYKKCHGA